MSRPTSNLCCNQNLTLANDRSAMTKEFLLCDSIQGMWVPEGNGFRCVCAFHSNENSAQSAWIRKLWLQSEKTYSSKQGAPFLFQIKVACGTNTKTAMANYKASGVPQTATKCVFAASILWPAAILLLYAERTESLTITFHWTLLTTGLTWSLHYFWSL